MKPMLSLLLCVLFWQAHAQDSMPKRLIKYKVVVREITGLRRTGYTALINDSAMYISTAPVAMNRPIQRLPRYSAIDYSQLNAVYIKRKGAVGRGLCFGALAGVAAGAIAGLVSGDGRSDSRTYYTTYNYNQYGYPVTTTYSMNNALRISAGEKAVVGAGLGMVAGSIIGGIIGAVARKKFIILGSKEKFNAMQLTMLEKVYGK